VQLGSQDLNGDARADLIVSVKNEQLLYLNDGAAFRMATQEERSAILKAQYEKTLAERTGESVAEGAGK
jgi:hypothetical protein